MDADVEAVDDVQSRFIDFRDDRVVGIGRRMNNPQSIIVRVKINDVELCGVKILSCVDVLNDFACYKWAIE